MVFQCGEAELAERLGVDRAVVKKVRDEALVEGMDWQKKGRRILLSDVGRRRLLEVLDSELPKKAAPDLQAALWNPGIRRMEVVRITKNRRVMMCRYVGEREPWMGRGRFREQGGLLRVLVNDTKNFTAGMQLRVRHRELDLWELVGRCPRWRGRW